MEKEIDSTYSLPAEENDFNLLESRKVMENSCESKILTDFEYLNCLKDIYSSNLKIMTALHINLFNSSQYIIEEFKQNGTYSETGRENPHQIFLRKLLPIIETWAYSVKPVCDLEVEKYKDQNKEIVKLLCNIDRTQEFIDKMIEMRSRFISNFIDYNAENNNSPKTENYKSLLQYEKE